MFRFSFVLFAIFAFVIPSFGQVVQFRLETTDMDGTPVDTIDVGDEFLLKTYTQHVGGYVSEENSGVFAAYLDISYDGSLISVNGETIHGELYSNGKSGDLSSTGLLNNIGGISTSPGIAPGATPIGLEEVHVFTLPMTADAMGEVSFVGSESLSYPHHDVLVYGLNEPVSARDIEFGAADLRIDFGSATLNVVPEPSAGLLMLMGIVIIRVQRRR